MNAARDMQRPSAQEHTIATELTAMYHSPELEKY